MAFLFSLEANFLHHRVGHVGMLVEIVVELLLQEVAYELVDCDGAARGDLLASELCLGLALKHRLLYSYAHSGHHAVANVGIFIPFTRRIFNCAAHMLLESGKVGASLGGVLSVDEGIVFLAILVGVCKHHFNVVALQMYDRVERLRCHVLLEQVEKSVAREVSFSR